MININFSSFFKSTFFKDVLTLATGSSIAITIPLLASPIITRIYTPDDMGVLALFASIIAILGSISTGRYEQAILLPKKNNDAFNIFLIGFLINALFSIFILVFFITTNQFIFEITDGELNKFMIFLIPFGVFFTGLMNLLNVYNNRLNNYFDLARATVIKSLTLVSLQLSLGFILNGSFGLIIGETFSKVFANLKLLKNTIPKKFNFKLINLKRLKILSNKYKNFPIYDVPATIFNISSFQLTSIFFNFFFNSSIAGLFYLTQKVLGAPVTIIANAVSEVFKKRASYDFNKFGNAKSIYIKTIKKLIILGFIPFLFSLIFIVDIFVFFFGEEWYKAGEYAQIMMPMLYLRFISNPLSYMFYIGEKQRTNLILQMLLIAMIITSFFVFKDDKSVVVSLSLSFGIFYIVQILISSSIAKVYGGK